MSLKNQVQQLFSDAGNMLGSMQDSGALRAELEQMEQRLDQPLRVAIIGIMKAGKSTFMNAFMNEDLVISGSLETTYNVTWFKYAPVPGLVIVFKDKSRESHPFSHLQKWTVRLPDQTNERLNTVEYVEVYYPAEVLRNIELIDTPGLNSSYNLDAQHTLDFLGVKNRKEAEGLEKVTIREASMSDAIIYVFSRSAGSADQAVLEEFQGSSSFSNSSPINAIGVLTKADVFWNAGDEQPPKETALRITSRNMQSPQLKRLLYTILPVSAKPVEGLALLAEEDWTALSALSQLALDDLADLLSHLPSFTSQDADAFDEPAAACAGSAEQRRVLENKICAYGIFELVRHLQSGHTESQIRRALYAESGMEAIKDLVLQHFGRRSFVIKIQYIFSHLRRICKGRLLSKDADEQSRRVYNHILNEIDSIENNDLTFLQLKLLQLYYNDELKFNPAEEEDFFQIMGERGRHCEARLGISQPMSVTELEAAAKTKVKKWAAQSNAYGTPSSYKLAAKIIRRSYEFLLFHLEKLADS